MKSIFQYLILAALFVAGSTLFLAKYDVMSAAKRDMGKFHEASLIFHTKDGAATVRFNDPQGFYEAYQTAKNGVDRSKEFKVGKYHFQAGAVGKLQAKLNTHTGNDHHELNQEWLNKISRCGCQEREQRPYIAKIMSGLTTAYDDLTKG